MKSIEETYEVFGRLVAQENIWLDPAFTFIRVCRMLDVSPCEMNALLEKELGLDGDTLFESMRAGFGRRLEAEYGLKCFFQDL